jgi:predicted ATPase
MNNKIYLKIKNFKCFYDIDIPLNNLTVFAGLNGNGKSTAIQALLFMRRTVEHCAKWENNHFDLNKLIGLNVELNGPYCLNLGNSAYIIPADSSAEETIYLGISSDDNVFGVTYSINTGNELWLTPVEPLINKFIDNPLYYQEFYYLNAERIGPRLFQDIRFYDYYNVGYKGEYTAQIISNLNYGYDFKLDEKRVNSKLVKGSRFEHHVNAWLNFILPGISIIPYYDEKTHVARIEVENNFSRGNPVVPTNTGFGISYVLPVIVSGLIAQQDRFLIVENPEAHLHPSAQSNIGYFLGVIANAGVRVIVETHSDHVINGIQLAVAQKAISNDAVNINFFTFDNDYDTNINQPEIKTIRIKEKGELTDWPKGFFDQSQIDYSLLIKQGKNV